MKTDFFESVLSFLARKRARNVNIGIFFFRNTFLKNILIFVRRRRRIFVNYKEYFIVFCKYLICKFFFEEEEELRWFAKFLFYNVSE